MPVTYPGQLMPACTGIGAGACAGVIALYQSTSEVAQLETRSAARAGRDPRRRARHRQPTVGQSGSNSNKCYMQCSRGRAQVHMLRVQGVILYGEPGTGKTLLAKAVANSTSATFLRVVGSELIQKYLGDGPKLVRELFRVADELAPSIVFIGARCPTTVSVLRRQLCS